MAEDELDRVLAAAAAELRRAGAVSPDIDRRVLAEIGRPRRRFTERAGAWLRTPRTIRVAPLSLLLGGAAALLVAAALLLAGRRFLPAASEVPLAAVPSGSAPVRFMLRAPRASSVHVVGDFNDWDAAATPLRRAGGAVWSVTIPLTPGRYRYTFVVDGHQWVADPDEPPALGDDFGRPTSVITVMTGKT